MSDDDLMKQDDIDALLGGSEEPAAKTKAKGGKSAKSKKSGGKSADAGDQPAGGMDQSEIDALLGNAAPAGDAGSAVDPAAGGGMDQNAIDALLGNTAPANDNDTGSSGGLLDQSDIDALMGAAGQDSPMIDATAGLPEEVSDVLTDQDDLLSGITGEAGIDEPLPAEEMSGDAGDLLEEDNLTEQEKDALGEIGNICMGSASTTLSMLLNHKVSITSPTVLTTTIEDLFLSFDAPYMTIYIKYIDGLSGFNLLIMRLQDAAVLADLMMGGEGDVTLTDELTEMGISAASEAMNQMIGSSSTSMASMFGTVVNISPPQTYVSHQSDDLSRLQDIVHGLLVVASFNMTVGNVLDTKLMQVMNIDTARETANLILKDMYEEMTDVPAAAIQEDELPAGIIEQVLEAPPPSPAVPAPAPVAAPPPAPARPAAASSPFRSDVDQERLDMLLDIPLKATALLGRTKWSIKDVLGIVPGSVVELDSLVDEPVEILVNGILVAMGEVVVVNENFGVRISSIIEPAERLKRLMQRKFSV